MMGYREGFVQCPYDPAHRILKDRFQTHLVKCRKNHPTQDYRVCPLNSTHHVPAPEFNYHMDTCPGRSIVETHMFINRDDSKPTAVPLPIELPPTEENWDDVTEPQSTYDPRKKIASQPVLRRLTGATKSERKTFRLKERERLKNLNDGRPPSECSTELTSDPEFDFPIDDESKEIRRPREPSKVMKMFNPNMGLGRGARANSYESEEQSKRNLTFDSHLAADFSQLQIDKEVPQHTLSGRGRGTLFQTPESIYEETSSISTVTNGCSDDEWTPVYGRKGHRKKPESPMKRPGGLSGGALGIES